MASGAALGVPATIVAPSADDGLVVAGAALVPVALLGLGLALVAGGVVDGDADVDSLGV